MNSKLKHGLAAAALAAGGIAGAIAAPAAAQAGSVTPVVTHPMPGPVDVPAGAVCAFGVHVAFPSVNLTRYTWNDSTGRAVFAIETGTMVATFTNTSTGLAVQRDLSGTGYYAYPDASTTILSGTRIAVFNGAGDSPANELLFANGGFMSVKAEVSGGVSTKTVLYKSSKVEDLCQTL